MRRLLVTLTILALFWCGWWMLGAVAVERGIAIWLDEQRAQGSQVQVTSLNVAGFPLTWRADIADFSLIQPASGVRIVIDDITANAPTYWPLTANLTLPNTPMTFETPQGAYFFKLQQGRIHAAVRPSVPVVPRELVLTSNDWQLNTRQGNLLSAQRLHASVLQDETDAQTYDVALDVDAFTPGDLLRDTLGLSPDWPRAFDHFLADLSLRIEQVADDRTVLRQFKIQEVNLIWGPINLSAVGQVIISAQGVPTGTLTLLIKNWRDLYDIIKENPTLDVHIPLQAELMLNGLANIGGDPNTLDLTLNFRDGGMYLGSIALGPAPKFTF